MASLRTLQSIIQLDPLVSNDNDQENDSELSLNEIEGQLSNSLSLQQLRRNIDPVNPAIKKSPQEIESMLNKLEFHQKDIDGFITRLSPVRSTIERFQMDLKTLSTSLVSSREKSTQLSLNRQSQKNLIGKLNPIILDLMIPPEVINSICNDKVDSQWIENLRLLQEKHQIIEDESYSGAPVEELKSLISDLTDKCVERIRDHIISQIKQLRSPNSSLSSQQIQQDLLQTKEAYQFLKLNHPDLAGQLKLAYFYTMKWYYETKFAKYIYALEKLKVRNMDVIFEDNWKWLPNIVSSGANSFSSTTNGTTENVHTRISEYLQSVEKRKQLLESPTQSIPSQIAETTPFSYWQEFVFQQWISAFVDNVIVEYLFVVDFWYSGDERFPLEVDQKNWHHLVFDNIFKYSTEFVDNLITSQQSTRARGGDAFAMLICIRMIQNISTKLHEIHIPILDEHLNRLSMELWPHFTRIIDANCEAMKRAILHTKSAAARLAPLAAGQQLAQLVAGLLKLSEKTNTKGEPLQTSIRRLRNDFEGSLTKLAVTFFKDKNMEKELFLFNNYFIVLNILKNEEVGEAFAEEIEHFEMLCDAYKPKK